MAYPWSSLKWHGAAKRSRPPWMEVGTVLGELGFADSARDRRRYVERMEERALEGAEAGDSRALKRGWILRGGEFRDRILEMMEGNAAGSPTERSYRRDHGEWQVERLVVSGLRTLGLSEADLADLRKRDWRKRVIGHVVKRETSVPLAWIAKRPRMGTDAYVSRICSRIGDVSDRREVLRFMKRLKETSAE